MPHFSLKVKISPVLFILVIVLCQYQQSIAQTIMVSPSNISPSHCRIVGKIIEILPVASSKKPTHPCENKLVRQK